MIPLETEVLPDGCIKVTLTQHGFTASCVVSSFHLVEDKRPQLLDEITNQALAAYGVLP